MRQIKTVFILVTIFLSIINSGCAKQTLPEQEDTPQPSLAPLPSVTPTSTPDIVKGTVVIWHGWEEAQRSVLFRQISAFQSIYPEVQFDVLYIPTLELRSAFETTIAEGGGPTLLIGPDEWGPGLINQGFIQDISNRVGAKQQDQMNNAARETSSYAGMQLGLPLSIKGVVLYRNKAIVPAAPKTFDELVALSTTATTAGKIGADLERSFFFSGGHLYGLGGQLVAPDGNPAFQENDYQAGIQWLGLLRNFEKAGTTEYQSDADLTHFRQGRSGFLIEGSGKMYELAGEISPLNLVIDPWPEFGSGRLAGFVQSENIYLTRRAENEANQISWLFMQSMFTVDAQRSLADVYLIPAMKPAALAGAGGEPEIGDPFILQALLSLESGAPYPITPEMHLYNLHFDIALQSYLFQAVNARAALEKAYQSIQSALNTLRLASTPTP